MLMSRKKRRFAAGGTTAIDILAAGGTTAIDKLGGLELEMILLRLSAVDLARCKRVCRAWRCLISSDDFVKAHLNRSRSDPSSQKLLVRNANFSRPRPGPFKSVICFSSEFMIIVGSVNGLICFAARKHHAKPRWFNFPVTPDNIWISNPLTGLCRKLPSPSSNTRITPHTATSKFAFWWDPNAAAAAAGVYKVAKIVNYKNGKTMVDLWESTSPDTWTTVNVNAPYSFRFDTSDGQTWTHPSDRDGQTWAHPCDVLIEGVAAYWIVANRRGRMFVFSLDLKTLQLKSIPLPQGIMLSNEDFYYFGGKLNRYLFGGNLNGEFVLLHKRSHSGMYNIWTMAKDNHSNGPGTRRWDQSFEICFDFPFQNCLGIMNGRLVFQSAGEILTLYDLESRTKEVFERDPQLKGITLSSACGFVGSLVSMDGFGFEYNDQLSLVIDVNN